MCDQKRDIAGIDIVLHCRKKLDSRAYITSFFLVVKTLFRMANKKSASSNPQLIIIDDGVFCHCSSPQQHVQSLSHGDFLSARNMPEGVILLECSDDCEETDPCQHQVKLQSEYNGTIYGSGLDGIEIALLIKAGKYRNLSEDTISHFADCVV